MQYRGQKVASRAYHGVPKGWHSDQIVVQHKALLGFYAIGDFTLSGSWDGPAWLPERYQWALYTETLRRVADGVYAGDDACVELAIRYIELRYIGSYSGFLRERLARALKIASMSDEQKARLNRHFLCLVFRREYGEFRMYRRLWARTITSAVLGELTAHFQHAGNERDQEWLAQLTRSAIPLLRGAP